jgi:hypothetical protein
MAKPTKLNTFESVLDKFNRELGESYNTSFHLDRANFNLPKKTPEPSEASMVSNTVPVGGKGRANNNPGDVEKFSDENAQLSMRSSSTIQSAAYWPGKQYLLVSFKSGATYSYNGVNLGVVEAWQQAASAGSFFYYNIRTSFSYRKI